MGVSSVHFVGPKEHGRDAHATRLMQRDLAERMGVHESMVSRDERNEYHGITVERASRILEAMGVRITTRVERIPEPAKAS